MSLVVSASCCEAIPSLGSDRRGHRMVVQVDH
jgi:hypothetical protein